MIAAVVLLVAAAGHIAIWVAIINRTHATNWPYPLVKRLTKLFFLIMLGPPPLLAIALFWGPPQALLPWRLLTLPPPALVALTCYLAVCWFAAAVVLVCYLWRIVFYDVSPVLRFHRRRSLDTSHILYSPDDPHHAIVRLPGNQSLKLDLTERGLDVPRLPPPLDGLSIVHLSDLHFTGKVARPFFEEVVRISNSLEPDLVAITGDLVDKTRCIDWIPDTLGRLKARYGVYCILGNHDLRVDWKRMLRVLGDCGLVHLGGRWITTEVRGQPLLLAGNELPWFGPAADPCAFPPRSEVPFRIMLAHSPDQLAWARKGDGDLMLAGHLHGGQIRLPLVGPLFSPSYSGVQYASGLFYVPPTILNVSRGLSAELPLRMNCTPEIVHLTLHTK